MSRREIVEWGAKSVRERQGPVTDIVGSSGTKEKWRAHRRAEDDFRLQCSEAGSAGYEDVGLVPVREEINIVYTTVLRC